MAIWFSSLMAGLFFASTLLYLISCQTPPSRIPVGLRRVECWKGASDLQNGPSHIVWDVFVAFNLVSMVLYIVHASMAWYVWRVLKQTKASMEAAGLGADPAEDEARAAEARERWIRLNRYGL